MKAFGVQVAGTGSYAPARILSNADLERMVETSDEWITTRTGIRERHIAAPDEATSDMATQAGRRALEAAGMTAADLDLIIVPTLTPDHPFPNTACYVQKKLGVPRIPCFGMEAACSVFLYALEIGASLVRTGAHRNVLIAAAEKLSAFTDYSDRNTCVLFGDGAGAVVLRPVPAGEDRFMASAIGAEGAHTDLLHIPAGGSAQPITHERLDQGLHFIKMEGREVFKLAVPAMVDAATAVLTEAGISSEQVRWLIPHQANTRIIDAVGKRLGLGEDRVYVNIARYGNTSAASIPLALDEVVRKGLVQRGEYVLMVAFGGGLTWGATLIRW